jgi:hypothetical protein
MKWEMTIGNRHSEIGNERAKLERVNDYGNETWNADAQAGWRY